VTHQFLLTVLLLDPQGDDQTRQEHWSSKLCEGLNPKKDFMNFLTFPNTIEEIPKKYLAKTNSKNADSNFDTLMVHQ